LDKLTANLLSPDHYESEYLKARWKQYPEIYLCVLNFAYNAVSKMKKKAGQNFKEGVKLAKLLMEEVQWSYSREFRTLLIEVEAEPNPKDDSAKQTWALSKLFWFTATQGMKIFLTRPHLEMQCDTPRSITSVSDAAAATEPAYDLLFPLNSSHEMLAGIIGGRFTVST